MSLWQKLPNKDRRLSHYEWPAYLTDLYRLFPRVLVILSTYGMWKVMYWYMYGLLASERTAEVSAFVGVIAAAYTKGMDYYMQRGVDWPKQIQQNDEGINAYNSRNSVATGAAELEVSPSRTQRADGP